MIPDILDHAATMMMMIHNIIFIKMIVYKYITRPSQECRVLVLSPTPGQGLQGRGRGYRFQLCFDKNNKFQPVTVINYALVNEWSQQWINIPNSAALSGTRWSLEIRGARSQKLGITTQL